ncbi:ATP-binding protein [Bacillus paralicheniformis]|uniref:hypothetical protein n=1 Tax=Bacillus paralicheniformis TaxID=1648923 RepID=UPI001D04203A|nr:hypothetical protein [Bacillus paralicheniformis]
MIFTITDSGKGFSQEGLQKAAELFYMEEKAGHRMGITVWDLPLRFVLSSFIKAIYRLKTVKRGADRCK